MIRYDWDFCAGDMGFMVYWMTVQIDRISH